MSALSSLRHRPQTAAAPSSPSSSLRPFLICSSPFLHPTRGCEPVAPVPSLNVSPAAIIPGGRPPSCCGAFRSPAIFVGGTAVSTALRITSTGTQTLYVAENQDIAIGCTYEVEAADVGSLDIEWSIINPDTTQQDLVILTYLHDRQFEYPNPLSGRFGFMEVDPSQGNASVRVRNLQASDTNTFQCKVKKAPGIDSRKVTVGVHIRPEKPECWIERSGEKDRDVVLHCVSHSGTPPLTYSWNRINEELLPQSTFDRGSGTLLIKDSTPDGIYRCSVSNLVGQQECELVLSSTAGHSKAGMIVGIVLGVLLALLLLLLLLWLLCCCCRRHRHKKERPNDIREDSAAPVSRASSMRSVQSYKAHHTRKAYDPVKMMDLLPSPSPVPATLYPPVPGVSPAVLKPTCVV